MDVEDKGLLFPFIQEMFLFVILDLRWYVFLPFFVFIYKLLRRVDTNALSKTNVNYFVYMVDKNKIISEEVIGFVTRCLEEEIHPETCPPWN